MRTSFLLTACALILGTGAYHAATQAMSYTTTTSPQIVRVASVADDMTGIETWARIVALGGLEDFNKSPRTFFAPSDGAFEEMPKDEVAALLTPSQREIRRAFLARGSTEARIAPAQVGGRSLSIYTLDGRPLTIDARGGELMVGDAEALDVRELSDGSVIYVLDHALPR